MLIYVCCVQHVFLMFKHWFCWKYQYNKCMFNFIGIYSFIPVSGCVGIGPSELFCRGPMILLRWPCSRVLLFTQYLSYIPIFLQTGDQLYGRMATLILYMFSISDPWRILTSPNQKSWVLVYSLLGFFV
jgi:hypothetical protein